MATDILEVQHVWRTFKMSLAMAWHNVCMFAVLATSGVSNLMLYIDNVSGPACYRL